MNVHPRQQVPLRRDPAVLRERSVRSLCRAVVAKAIAGLDRHRDSATVLRDRWPDDDNPIASLVLRGPPEPPASLTGCAGVLGRGVVKDRIAPIGRFGAGARLLKSGHQLVFDTAATLYVPALQGTASLVSFVAESSPIPVR